MKISIAIKLSINLIAIVTTSSLTCMDIIWHNPNIKDDIHLQLAQRYFSHDTVCALALVNKQWNVFIKETAEQRKTYIEKQKEYYQTHMGYNYGTHHPTT